MAADVQRELAEALARDVVLGEPAGWVVELLRKAIADAEKRAAAKALRDAAQTLPTNVAEGVPGLKCYLRVERFLDTLAASLDPR